MWFSIFNHALMCY